MLSAQEEEHPGTISSRRDIAFLIPTLDIGGAERVIVTLANEFVRKGYPTRVICGRAQGRLVADLSADVSLVDLDASRFRYALLPLMRHLRNCPPRVLLAMLTQSNLTALAASRFTRSHIRVILSERSSITGTRSTPEAWWQPPVSLFLGLTYRKADGIIVPSGVLARELADISVPPDIVHVVPNPIDIEQVKAAANSPPEHPWFEDGLIPVITAVGRLTPSKDLTTLVRAFAIFRRSVEARLAIIGEGPERTRIEACIRAQGLGADVALLGALRNPYSYMARSAVVASSSVVEGFPNVLVEALALGVPVVATDCPTGPSEILRDGEFGELVAPNDPAALALGILRAIARPPGSARLVARAARWSADRIAERYLASISGVDG